MAQHIVQLRNLRIAPRKVRLIADLVRGMSVNEAEARLSLDRHRSSLPILKLLRSAVAGAAQKEMNMESLFIAEIRVDQGSMMKRYMPRAQGRGVQIQKKMSHIILGLGENPHQARARFTMPVREKKSAAAPEEKKKVAKPRAKKEEKDTKVKKDSGGIKRTFGRKAPQSEG